MIGRKYNGLIVENYWTKSNGDLELLCLNPQTGKRVIVTQEIKRYGKSNERRNQWKRISY
jgi:hypothetical protein